MKDVTSKYIDHYFVEMYVGQVFGPRFIVKYFHDFTDGKLL